MSPVNPDTPVRRDDLILDGAAGSLAGYRWIGGDPTWVAVLVHGYGEHSGRYEHVATRLVADGAVVFGHDHVGHGRSDGERALIADYEPVVDDVGRVVAHARRSHPGLPVVLIGHSMGGLIAARYTQRFPDDLACTVLSAPLLGQWTPVTDLLAADEIPPTPIDPATLSRDPAVGEAYEKDPLVWHGNFKRPTIQALQTAMETVTAAGRVAVPTLWLHGEDDHLVPIDGAREGWAAIRAGDAQERSYPGARHEIFNELNSDEVLDEVVGFVHRHVVVSPELG